MKSIRKEDTSFRQTTQRTEILDPDNAVVPQTGALNSEVFGIGYDSTIATLGQTQLVDGKACLCSKAVVEVGCATLQVCASFGGELADGFA